MENIEIEVKFLEVDKIALIEKLKSLGARDLGEEKITEEIFYVKDGQWKNQQKFARIRTTKKGIYFTYKHSQQRNATGVTEIEFTITEPDKLKAFLEAMDLVMARNNEKMRHKFMLGDVVVDIDTWPKVPTYVELEGPSEDAIKRASEQLGFQWEQGVFGTAAQVIEEVYKLPVSSYRYFTFDRVE